MPLFLANFLARLGPMLGRLAATNKDLLLKLADKLAKSGHAVKPTVTAMVDWAKANPGNALVMASNLAALGYAVFDWFGTDDKSPEALKTIAGIDEIYRRTLQAAALSETIHIGIGESENRNQLALLRDLLSWARQHYGSVSRAVEAHRMNQAFFELAHDDVVAGFEMLSVR